MNVLEFAMSVVRAPWLARLTDRSFLAAMGTALTAFGGLIALWQTEGVPVSDKVNATIAFVPTIGGVIAIWTHGMQKKDAAVSTAAIAAASPQATTGPPLTGPILQAGASIAEEEILAKARGEMESLLAKYGLVDRRSEPRDTAEEPLPISREVTL